MNDLSVDSIFCKKFFKYEIHFYLLLSHVYHLFSQIISQSYNELMKFVYLDNFLD